MVDARSDDIVRRLHLCGDLLCDEAADYIEHCHASHDALVAEIERLKALLNDGHVSLTKENEQLRWACASKDAESMMLRAALSANVVKG